MSYIVPQWVAHRCYISEETTRVAISNERDREFVVLDDASAILWSSISENPNKSIALICRDNDFPIDEVNAFVEELVAMGLLVDSVAAPLTGQSPLAQVDGDNGTVDAIDAEFEIQQWAKRHGFLWSASWELTYRCNEECLHCYNPGASHDHSKKGRRGTRELRPDEWKQMLSDLKDIGVFRLSLTGGETLVKTDLFEILSEAKSLGFSVSLLTNGILIDDEIADKIAQLWLNRVELSLYSIDPVKHDYVTAVKGSHELTIAAVKRLRDRNVPVMLKMVLTKNNLNDIDGLKLLAESLSCDSVIDSTLSIGNDGSPETYIALAPSAAELIKAAMDPNNPLWCGTPESPRNVGSYSKSSDSPCSAGHSVLSISPEGNIYPCVGFPMFLGSQRVDGVKAVWRSSFIGSKPPTDEQSDTLSRWQKVMVSDFAYCGEFARCIWCQKCAGLSFLESGNATAPSAIKCRNAAARMVAYDHICNGGTENSLDDETLSAYRDTYKEERSLWNEMAAISRNAGSGEVAKVLKDGSKQRVLMVTRRE